MAMTGTGKMLSTLTYRSVKIALFSRASTVSLSTDSGNNGSGSSRTPKQRMEDLARQLKDVVFDVLLDHPAGDTTTTTTHVSSSVANQDHVAQMVITARKALSCDRDNAILLVSDQDSYLKAAKDMGMVTCRIRPKNAKRGNVSTTYEVETILQVENVVNEMNGISYNAVLNM